MSGGVPAAGHAPAARVLAGIALGILATAFFASMDTLSKVTVMAGVPVFMGVFMRYLVQALATTAFVLPRGGLALLRTQRLGLQVLRGALLATGTALLFAALRYMPVGEFTAILMLAPLVITLVAGLFFREMVSPLRWALILGGFAGTMIIIRPAGEGFSPVMLLPLAQVGCITAFQLLTSRLARTEHPLTTHLYTGWVGTFLMVPALPFVWIPLPSAGLWGLLLVMGLLASVGHFLLILAFQRAPASTLTPYMYIQIGFAMLGGWIAFGHVPDGWSALGMALIAACGVASAWLTIAEQRRD